MSTFLVLLIRSLQILRSRHIRLRSSAVPRGLCLNNEVSNLLIQETVGSRLTHPWSFLRLLERNTVKGSAGVMGRTKESRLSFSFFSFPSHLLLPSVTLLSFRLPRAIQIGTTGVKSG